VFASAGKTVQAHDTHNAAAAVHAKLRARHQRQVAAGNIENVAVVHTDRSDFV